MPRLVTQVATAAFNDSYSELMPYTPIANSYWVSFHIHCILMPRPRPLDHPVIMDEIFTQFN